MSGAHTLATEEGLARFVQILNAQYAWSGMTKTQRAAVASRLHGRVTAQTLAALERRSLVRDGLLTAWGDWVRLVNNPEPTEPEQSA